MPKKLKKLSPSKTNSTTSSSNESEDLILNNNNNVKTNSIFDNLIRTKSLKSSETKSLTTFKSIFSDEIKQSPEIKNRTNVLKLKRNLLKERLKKFNSKSSSTSKSTSKSSFNSSSAKRNSIGELIDILLNCNLGSSSKDIDRDRFNIPRNQDEYLKQQSVLSKNLPKFLSNFDVPNIKFSYKTINQKSYKQMNIPLNSDYSSLKSNRSNNSFENRLNNIYENRLNSFLANTSNNPYDNSLNNAYDSSLNNGFDNYLNNAYNSRLRNPYDNRLSNTNNNLANLYDNQPSYVYENRSNNQNYKQRYENINTNQSSSVISELFLLNYRLLTSMEQLTEVVEYVINVISTLLSVVNLIQERTTTNASVNEVLERLPNRLSEELANKFDRILRKYFNEKK